MLAFPFFEDSIGCTLRNGFLASSRGQEIRYLLSLEIFCNAKSREEPADDKIQHIYGLKPAENPHQFQSGIWLKTPTLEPNNVTKADLLSKLSPFVCVNIQATIMRQSIE